MIGNVRASDRFDRVFTKFTAEAPQLQILADRDRRAAVWMDFQGAEHLRGLFIDYAAPLPWARSRLGAPCAPVVGPPIRRLYRTAGAGARGLGLPRG